MDLTKS